MKTIGKGSYGQVLTDGKIAVKQFTSLRDLTREAFCVAYISRDSECLVKILGCNFDNLTMELELWNCSLQSVLDKKFLKKRDLSSANKHALFSCILKGVAYIHSRNIVHADIKPGNILCNKDRTKAAISDYGLSSISFAAKVSCTSPAYKPLKCNDKHRSFDMFAICLIGLELFTDFYLARRYTKQELSFEVKKANLNSRVKSCLLRMLTENPRECIKAEEAYKELYQEEIEFPRLQVSSLKLPSSEIKKAIKEETKSFFEKYEIRRPERCHRCILLVLGSLDCELSKEKIRKYTYTMFYLFSIVFGKKVDIAIIQEKLGTKDIKIINSSLAFIIGNPIVLSMMYAP